MGRCHLPPITAEYADRDIPAAYARFQECPGNGAMEVFWPFGAPFGRWGRPKFLVRFSGTLRGNLGSGEIRL